MVIFKFKKGRVYIPLRAVNLHSNMVIFKWRKLSQDSIISQEYLHSNMVIFKFSTPMGSFNRTDKFTFQSGDIQINVKNFKFNQRLRFTFQSGDIQIFKRSRN